MSRAAWFSLGLAVGMNLIVAGSGLLSYLDARSQQYVRTPGSAEVVRLTGRKPA